MSAKEHTFIVNSILRLVLGVHIREFLEEKPVEGDCPILMLLDEFPQLGETTAIEKALEPGGYGQKSGCSANR